MTVHESAPPPNMPPPIVKTPPMVVWALVLSILGFCGVTAIVGIVLGFVGRGRAKEVGKGVGQATAAIVIGAAWLLIALIGFAVSSGDTSTTTTTEDVAEEVVEDDPQETEATQGGQETQDAPSVSESTPDVTEPITEETSTETLAQSNAISTALNYLDFQAFSKQGLIEQLEFEGYSSADAQYAVDNIVVDWSEQAALKAAEYLNFQAFSRSGLIDQLEFEGFTRAQATFGVDAVGL